MKDMFSKIRRANSDEIERLHDAVHRRLERLQSYAYDSSESQLKTKLWAAWHKSGKPVNNIRKEVNA